MAVSHLRFLSPILTLLLLLHFNLHPLGASPTSDIEALMAFKAASDPSNTLAQWNNASATPCSFRGVSCTASSRVNRLVLEGLGLRGSLDPLAALTQLRVLSLKRNRLSGPIPDLSDLTSLKLLFLSENSFSGEFPSSVTSLSRLYRLDLSRNDFSGPVPPELNRLTHLLTLRLESNRFTGPISSLNLPNLQDLNVSGNFFSGRVPESLSVFPESAFSNNPDLVRTGSSPPDGAIASPLVNSTVVSSTPSSIPAKSESGDGDGKARARMSSLALVAIILGDVLVVVVISVLLYCFYASKMAKSSKMTETEKIVYSSSPYPAAAASSERGRMVFFEGVRRFELEDLLRASAEMLGKGGFGTAYKAVLDDGAVVAVKRLKDVNGGAGGGRKEFEQQMEVLGRLRHPNLVSLRAYYYAREEKLLVFDFMPNSTLFWLLHGNRGPGRTPLDWTTRLKIAAGTAHGLAFIHNSLKPTKLVHGNIKSTNVLLDRSGNACLSDFGLSIFASRSNGYRAPEAGSDTRKLTQKSDVYSFGVLLLEILTGKFPSAAAGDGGSSGGAGDLPRWVQSVVREEWTAEVFDLELMRYKDIEEEMVGLLQIAMLCTAAVPDQRPRMSRVVKMIEEIRGGGADVSPGHDYVSESPSVSEGTSQ